MKTIKQIAAAVTKATASFTDSQRTLCAALIAVSKDAVEIGAEGIAAFREQMLAERELHDCKNIRNYYSTLAGRAKYLAQLDPANCKTLSGTLAQTSALIDLEVKAHDLAMSAKKLETAKAAQDAKADADKAAKAAQDAKAVAEKADDAVAKAAAELAEKEAKRAADHAANVEREAAKIAKQAESAAAKVAVIEAKAAPKTVTATAPAGKGEELKPATKTGADIPKATAIDLGDMAAEIHSNMQAIAQAWVTYQQTPSKTIAGKLSTLINRTEASAKMLAEATK